MMWGILGFLFFLWILLWIIQYKIGKRSMGALQGPFTKKDTFAFLFWGFILLPISFPFILWDTYKYKEKIEKFYSKTKDKKDSGRMLIFHNRTFFYHNFEEASDTIQQLISLARTEIDILEGEKKNLCNENLLLQRYKAEVDKRNERLEEENKKLLRQITGSPRYKIMDFD